jgi:hypothetical protein
MISPQQQKGGAMKEGLRRFALAIGWLSTIWFLGWTIGSPIWGNGPLHERWAIAGLADVFSVLGWTVSWIIMGFATRAGARE